MEFTMIHLARALFVRSQPPVLPRTEPTMAALPASGKHQPVRARPLTPWAAPLRPGSAPAKGVTGKEGDARPAPAAGQTPGTPVARICSDPADARRTVITGRFAEVCAALDRLVMEQEALA
jgi:hypothetical protein